jgi:hypothetical protein
VVAQQEIKLSTGTPLISSNGYYVLLPPSDVTVFSKKYNMMLRLEPSLLPVDMRADWDWTEKELDIIGETAGHVKEACRNKNPAGIVWYTYHLLAKAGEKRARILLGKDADNAISQITTMPDHLKDIGADSYIWGGRTGYPKVIGISKRRR